MNKNKNKIMILIGIIFCITYVAAAESTTFEQALRAIMSAEDDLKEFQMSNLSNFYINDLLIEAKRNFIGNDLQLFNDILSKEQNQTKREVLLSVIKAYEETPANEKKDLNYNEVLRLTREISDRKNDAYIIIDTISLIEDKEKQYSDENVDTIEALAILDEAKSAFDDERYEEAKEKLVESETRLDELRSEYRRTKGLRELSKSILEKYWLHVVVTLIVLLIIIPPACRKIIRQRAKHKVNELNIELITINKLMKRAQESCFVDKKMSKSSYDVYMDRYRTRVAEIKHTLPVYEAISKGEHKKKQEILKEGKKKA